MVLSCRAEALSKYYTVQCGSERSFQRNLGQYHRVNHNGCQLLSSPTLCMSSMHRSSLHRLLCHPDCRCMWTQGQAVASAWAAKWIFALVLRSTSY